VPRSSNGAGVGRGIAWILGLSILIGWIPLIGGFVAGVVGGKKSGGVLNALMAALIPSLLLANLFVFLATPLRGIPLLGSIATASAIALAFVGLAPVVLGALLGGLISDSHGVSVSTPALLFVLATSVFMGYSLSSQLVEDGQRTGRAVQEVTRGNTVDRLSAGLSGLMRALPSTSKPISQPRQNTVEGSEQPAAAASPAKISARPPGGNANQVKSAVLFSAAGGSLQPFPCQVSVGGSRPTINSRPGAGQPSIEFGPTSQATYNFGPYVLPGLFPGQSVRGRLRLAVDGSDNYVHVAGFGESVSSACDYSARSGPADGRYPFPSVAYRSAAHRLEIAETDAQGRVDWVSVPFELQLGSWHEVEFILEATSSTSQRYTLWVDGKQVTRRNNHGVIRPDDALAVLIGATGSSSNTHVRYADISVELLKAPGSDRP
jgi:hypothetical protein